MQKDGTRATELINRIDEVHGAESNTTSADSSRHHENHEWPKGERSDSAALVASSDEALASYRWRG
jgi:hypothetical protein